MLKVDDAIFVNNPSLHSFTDDLSLQIQILRQYKHNVEGGGGGIFLAFFSGGDYEVCEEGGQTSAKFI